MSDQDDSFDRPFDAAPTRVLVADDDALVGDMLALYLNRQASFAAATCKSLGEMDSLIRRDGVFDLVLLDYGMPGIRGINDVTRAIGMNAPHPVILLSGNISRANVRAAISSGARGFIPKSLPPRTLVNAVNLVLSGETFLPSWFHDESDGAAHRHGLPGSLTPKERDVLAGLCEGMSNKEISIQLDISLETVKMHVRNLMKKLGAKNRTHAVLIALEHRQNL
ncbi:response regulator transcription factor [Rhodovulum sp. YNF3179]|uniref:response regulator transcription factor n=1 Tax=Rhodovulum sp. YNF3179 TaxID=3425127 RepID=UPI003D34A845